ncbi:MAG: SPOR domain-containing protein, partial [Pseudomonadota bacterium]|nr:SPOR domain-containing protein [Pseudomonadota bacterium]
ATGGTPQRFVELEQRVLELEAQLEIIQKQQVELLAKLDAQSTTGVAQIIDPTLEQSPPVNVSSGSDKVVTESILDAKLKSYTTGLEQRIDEKLEVILQYLTKGEIRPELKDKVLLNGASNSQAVHTLSEPNAPTEPKLTTPRIEQPLVKMVEQVQKPKAPVVEKPAVEYSEDVKWLLEQPTQHYVLQLASMTDKQALLNMVRQKGLTDTRIVLQQRNDSQRYVLVHGSYANKKDANLKSKEIKSQFGISPWVRKMKDLTSKLP